MWVFFCTNTNEHNGITSTVTNAINKGSVTGNNAYGFGNIVTNLNWVVSMGTLSGAGCESFAEVGTIYSAFTLSTLCFTLLYGETFSRSSNGYYYTTDDYIRVDDAMNEGALRWQQNMVWNTELDLLNAIVVRIGPPVNGTVYVRLGDAFQIVPTIRRESFDKYVLVNRESWIVLVNESIITRDLDVALCFKLSVSGILNTTIHVEYGTRFSNIPKLEPYLSKAFSIFDLNDRRTTYDENTTMDKHMSIVIAQDIIVFSIGRPVNKTLCAISGTTLNEVAIALNITYDGFKVVDRDSWTEIDKNTMIYNDIDIALCHELKLNGLKNYTALIEHGLLFSEVNVIEPYLNNKYAIIDSNDSTIVYNLNTTVVEDMNVIVKKTGRVVIEIEGVEGSDVDVDEIIRVIEGATGDGVHVISVDIVYDDDRKVTQVTVIVDNEESARDVVNAVDILDKGEGCGAGVLCRRGRVYVEGEELDVSGSSLFSLSITVLALTLTNVLFMIISS